MGKLINLDNLNLANKKVFLRVDFNVPIVNGEVTDELRIQAAEPTIRYLLDKDCAIILASHLGRPEGKPVESLSLKPIAGILSEILDRRVDFIDDCIGEKVQKKTDELIGGEILLLENLRFHAGEEANDPKFARQLANLAQIYVDDAFAAIHRNHASIVGVAQLLPHAAGKLVEEEYQTLTKLLEDPPKPFSAVIGGAKVSTKIDVLDNLIDKVDSLVIGGAMANTFLTSLGHNMADSVVEQDCLTQAKEIYQKAVSGGLEVILPSDFLVAKEISQNVDTHLAELDEIKPGEKALDLGPKSSQQIAKVVDKSHSIFWNGTLGYAEIAKFATASLDLAHVMIASEAETVIGGGDTAAFVDQYNLHSKFGFVSTGGGASLELLAGKKLPGIEMLKS
ncbi:MAG: phosphoglycerate kinase [bacterium]|nr:phosphoglycerate kinase [bacterium]